MNYVIKEAIDALDELHSSIPSRDYGTIMDGLQEIETLRDRDEELEDLWEKFTAVPVNPKTDCIEEPFMGWGAGIGRDEILRWFDKRHSKGVAYLMYRDGIDRTDQFSKLVFLKGLCVECESPSCQFNHGGECRFALVHERKPRINDTDGCIDYDYSESD